MRCAQRSGSCVFNEGDDSDLSELPSERHESEEENEQNEQNEQTAATTANSGVQMYDQLFTKAVDMFAVLGNKSKNFGYIGNRDSLCSLEKMNENYNYGIHFSYRFLVADIRVAVPSITLLISFPSSLVPKVRVRTPALATPINNCLFVSIPKQTLITYNTIITPSSRCRTVVNVPTVALRVLKGVNYDIHSQRSNADQERERGFVRLDDLHGIESAISKLSVQRFLCVGELLCTMRIAM